MKMMKKILIVFCFLSQLVSVCSCIAIDTQRGYIFGFDTSANGGYCSARISQFYVDDNKLINRIKQIEYYADEILVQKIIPDTANKLNDFNFTLANPDKGTKLQPVKHKWIISTDQGIFIEEKTLYVFLRDEKGAYTFVEAGEPEQNDTLSLQKARYRLRKEPSKSPPVVNIRHGNQSSFLRSLEYWTIYGLDNGKITTVEYFIDGNLVQTYTGELPHRFEVINSEKKPLDTELKLSFKVYDDEENVTEVPAFGKIDKDTRTELHDEKWMYIKKQEE